MGTLKKHSLKAIISSQKSIALITLIILFVIFSFFGRKFFTGDTMMNILESTYYVVCLSLGMTFVISTGGIDLSIGAVAMCSALIGGVAYSKWGLSIEAVLVLIVFIAMMFGVLNGVLTSYIGMAPFVATLGTQMISMGIGYIISQVQTMRYPLITDPDGAFKWIFYKSLSGFPSGIIIAIVLFGLAWFMFSYTKLGKYACAIGSNKEAARLSGVNVKKWGLIVYIVNGFFAGMAGIFYAATYTSILPGSGSGMEMQAIAATVIGGTSLAGGFGTISGTMIGVFIMAVLKKGLMTIGIQQQWQVLFTGMAVLAAVMLDTYQTKKRQRM